MESSQMDRHSNIIQRTSGDLPHARHASGACHYRLHQKWYISAVQWLYAS